MDRCTLYFICYIFTACECDAIGSVSASCDKESGNCTCKNSFAGKQCNQCQDGFYAYPSCACKYQL